MVICFQFFNFKLSKIGKLVMIFSISFKNKFDSQNLYRFKLVLIDLYFFLLLKQFMTKALVLAKSFLLISSNLDN